MTTYDTRALATAIMGEEKVATNAKGATRELRKFLRTDFKAREVATPGKGGRYAIDLNKRDLTAMTKRFKVWQEQQAKEAQARRDALAAAKGATPAPIVDDADSTDEVEGPSDEELTDIDAMIMEIADEG